jgi:hypothetical protein
MHAQAKSDTSASPPDLEKFLKVLAEPTQPDPQNPTRTPINIEGITGTDYELGGEFVFSVEHGREADAQAWLEEAGYTVEFDEDIVSVDFQGNGPGKLHEIVREHSGSQLNNGKVVKHVLFGEFTGDPGHYYVQIKFKEVRQRT